MEIKVDFGGSKLFHWMIMNSANHGLDQIILALDVDSTGDALRLVERLQPHLGFYKVGSQLFTREGPEVIRSLQERGVEVFLDLKWHDIPKTVENAVKAAVDLGVRFVTVHASGGGEMVTAALEATAGTTTQILAVTVLTSLDDSTLAEIGFDHTPAGQVLHFARLVTKWGVPGIVCSPQEIELIRSQIKSPLILVTPGVRSAAEAHFDQRRTLSAGAALRRGANHVVIGRPITQATDPLIALQEIRSEIE